LPEESELADVLETFGGAAVTINMVIKRALDRGNYGDLVSFLQDRTKRRVIAARMDKAGYSPIRNPDAKDRQWTINGRRYAVYVPKGVAPVEAHKLVADMIKNHAGDHTAAPTRSIYSTDMM
jgi:hypothetical protein